MEKDVLEKLDRTIVERENLKKKLQDVETIKWRINDFIDNNESELKKMSGMKYEDMQKIHDDLEEILC